MTASAQAGFGARGPAIEAASSAAPRRWGWVESVTVLAIVAAGALITWLRVPGDHRDRVWAEDGTEFLLDAVQRGPWDVVFQGYTGYQQFLPRIVVAAIWPFFNIVDYPVVVFAACSILTGLAAAAVYWLSRDLVTWWPARIVLASITILLPLAAQEVIGNLADLHTYAMWVAPWLLLYRPRNWWTSSAWAVVAFALVMTEIQTVFFVWLIAFGVRRVDRRAWPVFAAFLIGSASQIVTSLYDERASGEGPLSIPSTVAGWMVNTVTPLATADPDAIRALIASSGLTVAVIILIPIVASSVVALGWGSARQRALTIALLLGSAAVYTGSAWANSGPWFRYFEMGLDQIDQLAVNSRYGVASGLLLVAVVPVAAAILVSRWRGRLWATTTAWLSCVAVVMTLGIGSTMYDSVRDDGDRWSPAARDAVQECAAPGAPLAVSLPVSPFRSVELSCDDILSLNR